MKAALLALLALMALLALLALLAARRMVWARRSLCMCARRHWQ
jgi:hypothetical protein